MVLSITDSQHNNALHYAEYLYSEYRFLLIVMLSVFMLNDVTLILVVPFFKAVDR